MKKSLLLSLIALASFCAVSAQNKFEGYNIIVDVPTTHRAATCAVRYVPPSTVITVTDLDPSTPLKLTACDGTEASVAQSSGTTATMRASASDFKWCFRGEDEKYKISFRSPLSDRSLTHGSLPRTHGNADSTTSVISAPSAMAGRTIHMHLRARWRLSHRTTAAHSRFLMANTLSRLLSLCPPVLLCKGRMD
jgi:hypothetical protein